MYIILLFVFCNPVLSILKRDFKAQKLIKATATKLTAGLMQLKGQGVKTDHCRNESPPANIYVASLKSLFVLKERFSSSVHLR